MTRPTTQVDTVVVVDEHTFRPWIAADVPFLWDMLHLALFVPVGAEPLPQSVLDEPKVAHYLRSFGERTGDDAQVCEDRMVRLERPGVASSTRPTPGTDTSPTRCRNWAWRSLAHGEVGASAAAFWATCSNATRR